MKNIKTLWQIFLDALNEVEKYSSIYDFLNEVDEKISERVMDINQRQFEKYMWEFDFKSHDEVVRAIIKYHEHTMQRDISMGEMWDIEDWSDDYMSSHRILWEHEDEEGLKKEELSWELRKDILDTNE